MRQRTKIGLSVTGALILVDVEINKVGVTEGVDGCRDPVLVGSSSMLSSSVGVGTGLLVVEVLALALVLGVGVGGVMGVVGVVGVVGAAGVVLVVGASTSGVTAVGLVGEGAGAGARKEEVRQATFRDMCAPEAPQFSEKCQGY